MLDSAPLVRTFDWEGRALSGERLLLLRNIAAQMLRRLRRGELESDVINFSHRLGTGYIELLMTGVIQDYPGVLFRGQFLSPANRVSQTLVFMIPAGSEFVPMNGTVPLNRVHIDSGRTRKINFRKADIRDPFDTKTYYSEPSMLQ